MEPWVTLASISTMPTSFCIPTIGKLTVRDTIYNPIKAIETKLAITYGVYYGGYSLSSIFLVEDRQLPQLQKALSGSG